MDEHVARLEAKVEHIQSDITDMKADMREAKAEMRRIEEKFDTKIDGLKESVATMRLEIRDGFAAIKSRQLLDKVWWLMIAAGILGVMARGMKWI